MLKPEEDPHMQLISTSLRKSPSQVLEYAALTHSLSHTTKASSAEAWFLAAGFAAVGAAAGVRSHH